MRWLTPLVLFAAASGCSRPEPAVTPHHLANNPPPATRPATAAPADASAKPLIALPKPYVLHLPGVSGTSIVDHSLRDGLLAGGFDGPVEFHDWTCGDPGLPALHNRARNEQQAQIVAQKLTDQFRKHPEQPIYLVCHSGGSGPATWALEKLPADVKIHSYVMLAPALSPTYDLSKALSHVTGNAYCFYSKDDDLVLGTGTKLFGTIDGQRVDAAGRIGFEKPATAADPQQYAKLIQKPYDPGWSRFGHVGGHIGVMGTPFVQAVVAPLMLGKEATAELLKKSVSQPLPDVLWPK
jgi:hypothetical protein